jgi:hypothetical protein
MKNFVRLANAIILFSLLTLSTNAQTVDTVILGTVADASGAVVPGATVTVLSSATGVAKAAATNAQGEFEVRYLTPGTYDVSVRANGFSSQTQKGIVVQISQQEAELLAIGEHATGKYRRARGAATLADRGRLAGRSGRPGTHGKPSSQRPQV